MCVKVSLCNVFWMTTDLQQVVLINLMICYSKMIKSKIYLQQIFDPDSTKGAWIAYKSMRNNAEIASSWSVTWLFSVVAFLLLCCWCDGCI